MPYNPKQDDALLRHNLTYLGMSGQGVYKYGYNDDVGSGAVEVVTYLGQDYAEISTALQLSVSSSSANDASAGTGARTVQLYGLDASYNEINETVTLNGQTAVTTTETYLRIHRAIARSFGSGGINAGQLYMGTGTVTAGVPATKHQTIAAGEGQTLHAEYTIPNGKTGYLTSVLMTSGGNANAIFTGRLQVREFGQGWVTKDLAKFTRASPMLYQHSLPVKVPAKADIRLTVASNTNATDVSGSFELILV